MTRRVSAPPCEDGGAEPLSRGAKRALAQVAASVYGGLMCESFPTHTPPELLATALLLTTLYAHHPEVTLCWRRHLSGGPVLEDIAGHVITAEQSGSANLGYARFCLRCGGWLESRAARLRGSHHESLCDDDALPFDDVEVTL